MSSVHKKVLEIQRELKTLPCNEFWAALPVHIRNEIRQRSDSLAGHWTTQQLEDWIYKTDLLLSSIEREFNR